MVSINIIGSFSVTDNGKSKVILFLIKDDIYLLLKAFMSFNTSFMLKNVVFTYFSAHVLVFSGR